MDRMSIDDATMVRLQKALDWYLGTWKRDLAKNVMKQGWISEKQRRHLFSDPYPRSRSAGCGRGGYDGAPDSAGNGYVTGE